jgi:hypothetical protein
MSKKKIERGGSIIMSEPLFNDMLSRYFGLEPETLRVACVTTEHHKRAVKISFVTDDERFPELIEGQPYPEITIATEMMKPADKPNRSEIKVLGFEGITK